MRLTILAVGQMRGTPEAAVYDNYAARLEPSGRSIGLTGPQLIEIKEHGDAHEKLAIALDRLKGALIVALDETGKTWSSRQLAAHIGSWRDAGHRDVVFVFGPADGLNDSLRARADITLSLGKMTWPHLLARALMAEQLWRAVSILTGHPYHRD